MYPSHAPTYVISSSDENQNHHFTSPSVIISQRISPVEPSQAIILLLFDQHRTISWMLLYHGEQCTKSEKSWNQIESPEFASTARSHHL